jgi:hypothetical protein
MEKIKRILQLVQFQVRLSEVKKDLTRLGFILPFCLVVTSCATLEMKTYQETVAKWKSYKDVAHWMSNFSYDIPRFKQAYGRGPPVVPPRTPEETFKIKSGICFDAALFIQDALNRIDPSYKARIIFIENLPYEANHYVCLFKNDGKIFIMDYGTKEIGTMGTHGPFNSLEDYSKFYKRYHPYNNSIRYSVLRLGVVYYGD